MRPSESEPPIVLASASPRRHELLALLDLAFVVRTADVDETPLPNEAPARMAARLASAKAAAVAAQVASLVIAADTLVVHDDDILGKPGDSGEAAAMLRRLRGRSHQVLSGVSVVGGKHTHTLVESSDVWMRSYTDEEIASYVAGGDPMDKAGAYAIQHAAFSPVARLEGCPANVMGMPLCRVDELLRACGFELGRTLVQRCRPEDNGCAIRHRVIPS